MYCATKNCTKQITQILGRPPFDFDIETSKKKKPKNILQYKSFEELDLDLKYQNKLSVKSNLDYNVPKVSNLKMCLVRNFQATVNLLCSGKPVQSC